MIPASNIQTHDLLDMDAASETSEQFECRAVIPNSIDFYNPIVSNDFMNQRVIDLEDGDVISEGYLSKYKLYKVKTRKQDAQEHETEVSRRFSDFEWLHSELINKYGGYIIPCIPTKHLLTKINFESYEFSEKRRNDLQQFLQKLLNHKMVRYVPELRIFIEDKEQFISLLKGELVQSKTFEQKCDNFVSSFKGFFTTQNSQVQQRTTDLVRTLDNSDKELNNNETLLSNLSIKAEKFQRVCMEHTQSLKDEAKSLTEQQDLLVKWDGFGHNVDKSDLDGFTHLIRYNSMRAKQLYRLSQDWDNGLLQTLHLWLVDTDAALQACERRRNLIKELVIDQQRIEELKLIYSESNSRRDIEMDILKTKYQKNKDKSEKMSLIMTEEIREFTEQAQERFKQLLLTFKSIQQENGKQLQLMES